jgi:carboxyl-terminal processing protease
VRLLIRREPDRELAVSIVRSPIKLPTVKGFRRGEGDRWDFLLDPAHRIGYVQIAHLGSATARELSDAVNELEAHGGLEGLILDLRSCPGGLLESAVAVANLFLARGTIVSIHGRSGPPNVIAADGSCAHADMPLVVLVNGQTASAAEIVAGALQDNRRALVVGTRTLGKGSVQTLIKLTGVEGAIKLTTAQYALPGGRNIDRRGTAEHWGIDPDPGHFVPMDKDQSVRLLERREASEVIGGKPVLRSAPVGAMPPGGLDGEVDDPQLAAALGAILTRLESGVFAPGIGWTQGEIELFLKREDLQRRRDSLAGDLERLDRELSDLDQGPRVRR